MLKQLRFKNWRSLRDVTIDLSPITVFIGANSSGKTNIVDGIQFMRDSKMRGLLSLVSEFGYKNIQSNQPIEDGIVEFEFIFDEFFTDSGDVTDILHLKFDGRNFPFRYATGLSEGGVEFEDINTFEELPNKINTDGQLAQAFSFEEHDSGMWEAWEGVHEQLIENYRYRFQFLTENFLPARKLTGKETGDLYIIERDARNMVFSLELMQDAYPEIFEKFNEDAQWLLQHVQKLTLVRNLDTRDIELMVKEGNNTQAQTISVGTLRMFAMLTTLHALNIPRPLTNFHVPPNQKPITIPLETPGLIVIEEPDAALNPGVLQKFVELLRRYVDNPDGTRPRQIILTTHNPTFLNYFKPEEVRVVERGEDGYTTVSHVPDFVKENWLDEYALGEVWLTNLFGGTNS